MGESSSVGGHEILVCCLQASPSLTLDLSDFGDFEAPVSHVLRAAHARFLQTEFHGRGLSPPLYQRLVHDREVRVKRCQQLREEQGRSKNALAKDARLTPSCIATIESGGWRPYDVQLAASRRAWAVFRPLRPSRRGAR